MPVRPTAPALCVRNGFQLPPPPPPKNSPIGRSDGLSGDHGTAQGFTQFAKGYIETKTLHLLPFRSGTGLLCLILAFTLTACGGGGGSGGASTPTSPAPLPQPPTDSGAVMPSGGILELGGVRIQVEAGAVLSAINIAVDDEAALPMPLPDGLDLHGNVVDIAISTDDQDKINAPLIMTLRYSDEGVVDETELLPLHFNGTDYNPLRIISQDVQANTITFESRSFSEFLLAVPENNMPASYSTDFLPSVNGWAIENFGSYFAQGGNCFGMSAYATWFYNHSSDEALFSKYSNDIAKLVVMRSHIAQSQTWGLGRWRDQQNLSPVRVGRSLKQYLSRLGKPLLFLMGRDGRVAHAVVVYGYDGSGFYFYDVNYPGRAQRVTFDGTSFGTYSGYNSFGYAADASAGRVEDFQELTKEAEEGFTSSRNIVVTEPAENANIRNREVMLQGILSGDLASAMLGYAVKSLEFNEIPVQSGQFSNTIPISNGENTIILLARTGIQSNWYRRGATLVRTVNGDLNTTQFLATLTWEQGTDVDLWVVEPGGEIMYWTDRVTSNGLELDFDDTNGFGPEHATLEGSGTVLPGVYHVFVHHYRGSVPATGYVDIVIHEGTNRFMRKRIPFNLSAASGASSSPFSSTGSIDALLEIEATEATFEYLAAVDISNGTITIQQ